MGVDDREHQRRRPLGIFQVERRAAFSQDARRIDSALTCRIHERGTAATGERGVGTAASGKAQLRGVQEGGTRIDLGARLEQNTGDGDMVLRSRPHQRGFALKVLCRIRLRTTYQQSSHGIQLARARGGHQSGFAVFGCGVRIRAPVQQGRDHRRVAVDGRKRKRGHPVSIGRLRVGPTAQQQTDRFHVVAADGPMQCGRAVGFRHVHVRVLLYEPLHRRAIARFDRTDDLRGSGRRTQADHHHRGRRHHEQAPAADASELSAFGLHQISRRPLLTPCACRGTPNLLTMSTSRLACGVPAGACRWRPPFTPAAPPPSTTRGKPIGE